MTGFVVLLGRWVAERTFAWLMNSRRLAGDYEPLPARPARAAPPTPAPVGHRFLLRLDHGSRLSGGHGQGLDQLLSRDHPPVQLDLRGLQHPSQPRGFLPQTLHPHPGSRLMLERRAALAQRPGRSASTRATMRPSDRATTRAHPVAGLAPGAGSDLQALGTGGDRAGARSSPRFRVWSAEGGRAGPGGGGYGEADARHDVIPRHKIEIMENLGPAERRCATYRTVRRTRSAGHDHP
jgi:hypothetical protein